MPKTGQSQIFKHPIDRYPRLDTVLMIEEAIRKSGGDYSVRQLWQKLPKKVMWQTFQVIMEYLESSLRIAYDKEGYVVYIWNPGLYKKYKGRKDLEWNPK